MVLTKPYLSIVATTRNDDHGGSLNRRTQAFIDGVTGQAHRHRLETELLLVEWNPPADRAPLREVFRWPEDNPWCEVRIVTVPAELHARYRFADQLPMLQMIAKNVGVRRARGEYVLATNVDILFADEIFAFLAARRLEPDVLYRSDRVDVDRHVPLNVPIEKRLAHCRNTVLRIARKGGMWVVPEGAPARSVSFAQPVAYVPPVFAPRPRKQGLLAGRWSEVTQQGASQGAGFYARSPPPHAELGGESCRACDSPLCTPTGLPPEGRGPTVREGGRREQCGRILAQRGTDRAGVAARRGRAVREGSGVRPAARPAPRARPSSCVLRWRLCALDALLPEPRLHGARPAARHGIPGNPKRGARRAARGIADSEPSRSCTPMPAGTSCSRTATRG